MAELCFGVIGWGLRRTIAKLAHRPDEGLRVEICADPRPEAQTLFQEEIGGRTVSDFRDLIDQNLDAVFILSPDHLHEEQAVALLEAGIAVYLEKPMAITVQGCDRILAAAQQSGAKLYLGHNMRHFPVVRKMREFIRDGHIGQVQTAWCRHFVSYGGEAYFRDWHANRERSTGLLLQKGAHDLDVLHWLCNGYAKRVTAMGHLKVYGTLTDRRSEGEYATPSLMKSWPPAALDNLNPVIDVEDVSMLLMELDNGVLASYQQCMFTPDAWRNYTIIGDCGRIENFGDGPGSTIRIWNKGQHPYREQGDLEFTIPPADGTHAGADPAIIQEFVRYLREGGETDTSPWAARMAVAAGIAATESLRNGSHPVEVTQHWN
jgi:predicted dehydrogenase